MLMVHTGLNLAYIIIDTPSVYEQNVGLVDEFVEACWYGLDHDALSCWNGPEGPVALNGDMLN